MVDAVRFGLRHTLKYELQTADEARLHALVRERIGAGTEKSGKNVRFQTDMFVGMGAGSVEVATGKSNDSIQMDQFVKAQLRKLQKDFKLPEIETRPGTFYGTARDEANSNGAVKNLLSPGRDGLPSFVYSYDAKTGEYKDMRMAAL